MMKREKQGTMRTGSKIEKRLNRPEIELPFPLDSKLYMVSYPYKQWGKTVIDCHLGL